MSKDYFKNLSLHSLSRETYPLHSKFWEIKRNGRKSLTDNTTNFAIEKIQNPITFKIRLIYIRLISLIIKLC